MDEILARVMNSADATVGGGSASALAGAMAAGLAGMVARLSLGRGLDLDDEEYAACAAEADALTRVLHGGAREDADAYALVKDAHRLPRDADAQAEARRAAIHDALIAAARVPLQNARRALRALELCDQLDGCSNVAAATDLEAAWLLGDAAVRGCLANVHVNLEALPESMEAARVRREAELVRVGHARVCAPPKERA